MIKKTPLCLALLVGWLPVLAEETPTFTPAHFAEGENTIESLVKFPRGSKDVDVKIKCDSVVTNDAKLERVVCYAPDRHKRSYKDAIYKIVEDVELVPATVNGTPETVVMQYTVHFVRKDGEQSISVYSNHGFDSKKYGNEYSGVQRYDWGRWSSKGCRRHYRRFIVTTEALVGSDGRLQEYKLIKGNHVLGACEEDLENHIKTGSYIPAMKDGAPVQARFVETYLNYLDRNLTY